MCIYCSQWIVPWKWVATHGIWRNRGYTLICNVEMDLTHFMDHVHAFKGEDVIIINIYFWCDGFWQFRISSRLLWDHCDQVRLLGIIKTVWLVDHIKILKPMQIIEPVQWSVGFLKYHMYTTRSRTYYRYTIDQASHR